MNRKMLGVAVMLATGIALALSQVFLAVPNQAAFAVGILLCVLGAMAWADSR